MEEVTDPATLTQLNSGGMEEVTDPATLAQLNTPEKSLSGFMHNAASDVGNIASGVGSLAKGLVTHPIDTATNLAKGIIPATYNEYKTAIMHPIEHTYEHPVNTLLDALPLASGAMKLGRGAGLIGEAGEGAEAVGEAGNAVENAEESGQGAQAAESVAPSVSSQIVRPPVGSIVGGSDVPIAKDFVPTNDRIANSMFLLDIFLESRPRSPSNAAFDGIG
jgi:hypothetical protein